MIKTEIWLVDNDFSKVNRIKVSGHSGYDASGYDIVCSSVSTAVILTSNLLESIYPDFCNNEGKECIDINLTNIKLDEVGFKITKNFLDYILELKNQYPDYIKVIFK